MKNERIETISLRDASAELGVKPMTLKAMILNGTIPVGGVGRNEHSTQDRIVIVKARWDKYMRGEM